MSFPCAFRFRIGLAGELRAPNYCQPESVLPARCFLFGRLGRFSYKTGGGP